MSKNNNKSLYFKAYLNTLTAWIDKVAKMGVDFFLIPVMISLLGPFYYGVWKVLGQLNSYMATSDVQAGTSLKWVLSKERTVRSAEDLRKMFTSALLTNFLFLPIYSAAGAILIWVSPMIAGVQPSDFYLVRTVSGILVISFIINQVLFVFESALTGMNLAYKRIGIRAIVTIVGGVLTWLALSLGYGLLGIALVQLVIGLIMGLTFLVIVRNTVEWFGLSRVRFKEVFSFAKLSSWFLLMKTVDLANFSVDLLLLGYFTNPTVVSIYVITRFSLLAVQSFYTSIFSAVSPGMAIFVGEQNYSQLREIRNKMFSINWFLLTVCGSLVLLFNRSFVGIWTSIDQYGGDSVTFLLVLIFMFRMMQNVDSSILAMTLNVKKKVLYSALSAIVVIVGGSILIPLYGIKGLLIALLGGTLIMNLSFTHLVAAFLNFKNLVFSTFFHTTAFKCMLMLALMSIMSSYISFNNWWALILFLIPTTALIFTIVWCFILNGNRRRHLQEILIKIPVTQRFNKFFNKS